jgi:hypothetical protein
MEMALPIRSKAQRRGDRGEQVVHDIVDRHPCWIARMQNRDYGIDLEAELADPVGEIQRVQGKLIKMQVKARARVKRHQTRVAISIDRDILAYANELKLPVILVAVCLQTRGVWWVWLQEWAMLNEARLAARSAQKAVTISIPLGQTLSSGLDGPLQEIARGEGVSSVVLTLRDLLVVSMGWANRAISEGVINLLARVHGPSRQWTLQKTIDVLLGYGANPPFWMAQQTLPVFLGIVDALGDTITQDQLLRLVARGETCSRTGLIAMGRLYDRWPEHARSLNLPGSFFKAGSFPAAWYAAMRERFPESTSGIFGLSILEMRGADLRFENIELPLTSDVRDYILEKWPNRGDSVLMDCLVLVDRESKSSR